MKEYEHRPKSVWRRGRIDREENPRLAVQEVDVLFEPDDHFLSRSCNRRELSYSGIPWKLVQLGLICQVGIIILSVLWIESGYDIRVKRWHISIALSQVRCE